MIFKAGGIRDEVGDAGRFIGRLHDTPEGLSMRQNGRRADHGQPMPVQALLGSAERSRTRLVVRMRIIFCELTPLRRGSERYECA